MIPLNRRLGQSRPEGGFALRVYHQKEQDKRMPRYLVKCGCCDQRLEIYYSPDGLEINGVYATVENWREILLPLLGLDSSPPLVVSAAQPGD
jgi:hypothetical protein